MRKRSFYRAAIGGFWVAACMALMAGAAAEARPQQSFESWMQALRAEARAKGISQTTVSAALHDRVAPIGRIVELDRKQPESTITFATYAQRTITQDRVNKGRRLMQENKQSLMRASEATGVQPEVIVALWGIETSYGANTGGFDVVPALVTLAYDGRRSDYFRSEVMKALQIIDQGHISADNMKGSWAGAMGQCQFMPSSFLRFAVDGDGDGRKDIWTTRADVFASTANYLKQSGWDAYMPVVTEVKLPNGFNYNQVENKTKLRIEQWRAQGVTDLQGRPVEGAYSVRIGKPRGEGNRYFMIYDNYDVVLKWNNSSYFAASVGLLANAIKP